MDTRRARTLAGSTFMLGLLVSAWVSPVAAADCALSAPATVRVGTPLTINGSGFPVSSAIDVTLTIEGGTPDRFTATSNAAGAFRISLTPEKADLGKTTVVATAGSTCSAQVIYTIVSSSPTATATAAPRASGAAASGRPTAPRTDAAPPAGDRSPGERLDAWLLAIGALVIGAGGLIATGPSRSR